MKIKNQPFKYSSLFSFNKQVKNEKRKKENQHKYIFSFNSNEKGNTTIIITNTHPKKRRLKKFKKFIQK